MTNNISRRAILACALAMSTVTFATSPAHVPSTLQFVQPDARTHRADIYSWRRAPSPQLPIDRKDPFADMLLG
jgi:hypothetical protein